MCSILLLKASQKLEYSNFDVLSKAELLCLDLLYHMLIKVK